MTKKVWLTLFVVVLLAVSALTVFAVATPTAARHKNIVRLTGFTGSITSLSSTNITITTRITKRNKTSQTKIFVVNKTTKFGTAKKKLAFNRLILGEMINVQAQKMTTGAYLAKSVHLVATSTAKIKR